MKIKDKNDFLKLRNKITNDYDKNKNIRLLLGSGTCGLAAGAKAVDEALSTVLADKNIKNAEIVRVGCIGYCYAEPTIEIVYPDGDSVILGHLTPDNVHEIVSEHIERKSLDSEFVIPRNFD